MGLTQSTNPDGKCPKCAGPMIKHFKSISGGARYMVWQCDECGHEETKCIGLTE